MNKSRSKLVSKFIIIVALLLMIYLIIWPIKQKNDADHVNGAMSKYMLNKGDNLEYKFISKLDSLSEIAIYLSNNSTKHKTCSINIKILHDNKEILNKKVKNTDIKNKYIELRFDEILNSNKEYTLILDNNCEKSIIISLYDKNDDSTMMYNGLNIEKGIVIKEKNYIKSYSYLWYPIMLLLIGLLTYTMSSNVKGEKNVKKTRKK